MISATEAIKLSTDVASNDLKKQLDKIEKDIKAAAQKGERTCYIDYPHYSVKLQLEKLGYTVKIMSDPRDGSYTTITW